MIRILLFYLNYQFFKYLDSVVFFMSSYGLNVIVLAFCVCGSTAAVHSGDASSSSTWS